MPVFLLAAHSCSLRGEQFEKAAEPEFRDSSSSVRPFARKKIFAVGARNETLPNAFTGTTIGVIAGTMKAEDVRTA